MTEPSFRCATCGEEHSGLPKDYGFGLPDAVFALNYVDRYRRSRSNSDLCTLDEVRFFIRGVLPVPFVGTNQEFVWGVWAEVSRDQHDLYVAGFNEDLSDNPPFEGHLANEIPGYGTIGLPLQVRFSPANDRPSFPFLESSSNPLSREQREGIP